MVVSCDHIFIDMPLHVAHNFWVSLKRTGGKLTDEVEEEVCITMFYRYISIVEWMGLASQYKIMV